MPKFIKSEKEKIERFSVTINVIEARHLCISNADSVAKVTIDRITKCTSLRRSTDCPYYNEFFVFDFKTTIRELLNKRIEFTIIQPRSLCRPRKILGIVSLEIETVWLQPDHQIYHKWALLNAGKDHTVGPRGYLYLDICILYKGHSPKIPDIDPPPDDIQGNLLFPVPPTVERQHAVFTFNIYRGEAVMKTKKNKDIFLEVHYANSSVRTTSRKRNSKFQVWNEQLQIIEHFPPYSQRFHFELKVIKQRCGSNVIASHYMYFNEISDNSDEGFLPMFGPSFIHFYNKENQYCGRILLEIKSAILSNISASQKKCIPEVIKEPLNEKLYWKDLEVILFSTIIEANALPLRLINKKIYFEIDVGKDKDAKFIEDSKNKSITHSYHPRMDVGDKYAFVELDTDKAPCMSIYTILPDLRKNMFTLNCIQKIYDKLSDHICNIERLLDTYDFSIINTEFSSMLVDLENQCQQYLDNKLNNETLNNCTVLEQKHSKIRLQEIGKIYTLTKGIPKSTFKKKYFRKIQSHREKLGSLLSNNYQCWPDIIINMRTENKILGTYRIPARTVCFSTIPEESGTFAGKLQYVVLKSLGHDLRENHACHLRIYIWLGAYKYFNKGLERMKKACQFEQLDELGIPRFVAVQGLNLFQAKVFIHQGVIIPGADSSGLCDPFLRIIVKNNSKDTQAVYETLTPRWDEMLVFNNIKIRGMLPLVLRYPPEIIMELYDLNICNKIALQGRCVVLPKVKLLGENDSLPQLEWIKIMSGTDFVADILGAFQVIQMSADKAMPTETKEVQRIPREIKPILNKYRIEVLFWGLRNLGKIHYIRINKPKLEIKCGMHIIKSSCIHNANKNPNFVDTFRYVDVELPNNDDFCQPMEIQLFDNRSFGRSIYAGINLIRPQIFLYKPLTRKEWEERRRQVPSNFTLGTYEKTQVEIIIDQYNNMQSIPLVTPEKKNHDSLWKKIFFCCAKKKIKEEQIKHGDQIENAEDTSDWDWWTRFYASTSNIFESEKKSNICKIKIYNSELEFQSGFHRFEDLLTKINIYRGARTGDAYIDDSNLTGTFKGSIKLYRWPLEEGVEYVTEKGYDINQGVLNHYVLNDLRPFLVRVYVIRGINLRPKDLYGKSDPYIYIKLGSKVINDKQNYVPNQTSPVFGRLFEILGVFPHDYLLDISVWDWDATSADDFIGETKIDLENRFYTMSRARCGMSTEYSQTGYNAWRDYEKPSEILEKICRDNDLDGPWYEKNTVIIGNARFTEEFDRNESEVNRKEKICLKALHNWKKIPLVGCALVPEHVETRSLYHPQIPDIEQGKLQLWIDIFPLSDLPMPPPIDISPPKPTEYELRVIIWNTEDVVLVDDTFFSDEKMSDIYVKGWLTDPQECQYTDIHYHSMTGEGNFNWRFVFNFHYLPNEDKMVVKKQEHFFSTDYTELKIPCRLELQIWDNDMISAEDFLGNLQLPLSNLPRGAKISKLCDLRILEPEAPRINIFKIQRYKGWWPMRNFNKKTSKYDLTGKIELEFLLLKKDEAEKYPVGLGRNDPQGLSEPNRPDTSFSWLRNPLKSIKFIFLRYYKTKILKFIALALVIFFIGVSIYSIPGYTVKKLIGARK